jgi:hypothetical protein
MAYQIYRIGEWERVGGVDGYSTIRAYLQPGLYETEAYARKKAARLADHNRPSLAAWLAAHPHVFDFDDCPF